MFGFVLRRMRTTTAAFACLGVLGIGGGVTYALTAAPASTAPTITSHPPALTNTSSASFGFTSAQSPVSFRCARDGGSYTACTSPKSYAFLPDGAHDFSVRSVDAAGRLSNPASFTWTIDTTPPSIPVIRSGPPLTTGDWRVTFAFDGDAGVSYECQMDSSSWASCSNPKSYTGLPAGAHLFSVRAVDAAGNRSLIASSRLYIQVVTGSAQPFTMTGNARGALYPGAAPTPIAVTLSNPNAADIFVTSLTVSLATGGLPAGCNPSWFSLTPSDVSADAPVKVPARGSVTLPAQGVAAPMLALVESGTNQDACRNARLTLNYSGSAHS